MEPSEETEPKRIRESGVLREVMTSLRPFMTQFGLVSSRVAVFMMNRRDNDQNDRASQFPTREMMKTIVRHEREDETGTLAVLSFLELLLSEGAPPTVLTDFMEALFTANHDRQHPNANPANQHQQPNGSPGAWRVHDIIQLACVCMPLQKALHDYLAEERGENRHIDVQGVLTGLSERRLLDPEMTPLVMETLELDGPETALVRLLASVYATHVDMLKADFEIWLEDMDSGAGGGGSSLFPPGGISPFWLRSLVEVIEANKGDGFSRLVPDCVFSPDTWNNVYDQLAYGRRGRIFDDEDTESVSGESVATLQPDGEEEEDRPVATRPRLSAPEERLWNMDQRAKQRRTFEYVLGMDQGLEIPAIMKIISYEFQTEAHSHPPATSLPSSGGLDEDCVSIVTESIENNSLIPDSASVCGSSSSGSSSNARLRQMLDLTRPLHISSDGMLVLRSYQEELLHWARQGCNVAIFLPTGTGKTFIVLRYMQEHINRPGLNRVVFLAPKIKLAEQQYHRFNEFFPHATYFRCGKSRSSNAPFSELLDTYKVYVMTPQCLVEAVQNKEVQMSDFSMLVLDECHHAARGKHAFKVLMDLYMDAKYVPQASPNITSLPQVIGLTASPGVGSQGNLDSAISHIRQLCFIMDVEKICTVRKNQKELERYINEPKHEIHTCTGRKRDGFKRIMEEMMSQIERSMRQCVESETAWTEERQQLLKTIFSAPSLHRGRALYHHWVGNLEDKLADFSDRVDTYKALFSMTEILMVCQRCLVLNEDCDSQYALEYLKEQLEILEDQVPRSHYSTVERRLLDQFIYRIPKLQQACDDPEDYNPKLRMLEEILLAVQEKNQDACACMVFVRTLELTKAIQSWMLRHPQLKDLKPGRITGHRRAVTDGGMKRQEIADVMSNFNLGEHKLVVCTSAAEEGLDFQACNLVVRYDYVTSMISMIQTRGRARRMDSQYCLLGSLTQKNVNREQENLAWERLMNKAVEQVQQEMDLSPNAFQEKMHIWQKTDSKIRKHQEEMAVEKQRMRVNATGVFRLLCRKCQAFACMSTDFRLLCGSNRAVVGSAFGNRWKRVERGDPVQIKHNLEKVAKVHCRADRCGFDWGIVARYLPTGHLLPVLKIESFFLEDYATGDKLKQKFKWSQAPFHVPDITEAELA